MGGDGMGGLALGIALVIGLMLAAGFGIAFWLGRGTAKPGAGAPAGATRGTARGLLFGVMGLAIAAVGVSATFYESSFSPPPRLDVTVPAGYAQPWTIVLEDANAGASLDWQGSALPFTQRHASLSIPQSGVARVRSLGEALGRGDLEVNFSDGARLIANGGGPAPVGSRASNYLLLGRAAADGAMPEAPSGDSLANEIAAREGR